MKWYIIIMVCLTVCVPQMTGAGTETSSSLKGLNGTLIQNQEPTQHSGIYFAQNGPKKRSNTATNNDDFPKAEEKTNPSAKQIKPFVPSEKIPADQGVDFPYDI